MPFLHFSFSSVVVQRLIRKIGTVDERTFRELAKALVLTLFPFLQLK